ncbi:MAG: hypothetical protein E7223_03415 [Clostridiales bacterium]|nr:hypothetical protein [Clostridiales bacterium]
MKDNTFQTKRVSFFERHLITAAALGAEMAYVVGPGAQASPELLSKDAKEELPADFPLLTFRDPEAFFAALTAEAGRKTGAADQKAPALMPAENLTVLLPALAFQLPKDELERFLLRLAPFCKEGSTLLIHYPGGPTIPEGFPLHYSDFEMEDLLSRCHFRLYEHKTGGKGNAPALGGKTHDLPHSYCLAVRKPRT